MDTPGLGSAIFENTEAAERFNPEIDVLILVTGCESPVLRRSQSTRPRAKKRATCNSGGFRMRALPYSLRRVSVIPSYAEAFRGSSPTRRVLFMAVFEQRISPPGTPVSGAAEVYSRHTRRPASGFRPA